MCRLLFILLLLLCTPSFSYSQFVQTKAYSTKDGLPTNQVYQAVEDNEGFLWLATSEGAVRFDGKYFQTFTRQNGLSDNDVLDIIKDKSGRLWTRNFLNSPGYFDGRKNQFITQNEDSLLKGVNSKSLLHICTTIDQEICYIGDSGTFIFSDGKKYSYLGTYPDNAKSLIKRIDSEYTVEIGPHSLQINKLNNNYFFLKKNNKIIEEKVLFNYREEYSRTTRKCTNNRIYIFYGFRNSQAQKYKSFLTIVSNISVSPLNFETEIMNFTQNISNLSVTPHYLITMDDDKQLKIYNADNKKVVQIISTPFLVNSVYEDKNGTLWLCTNNQGLIKMEMPGIQKLILPDSIRNIPYSHITKNKSDNLLLGTKQSRVIEVSKQRIINHPLVHNSNRYGTQKEILFANNKVFTFSDVCCSINYEQPIFDKVINTKVASKAAVKMNDSIIIFGNAFNLLRLNTKTNEALRISVPRFRTTCITKFDDSTIYCGSLDGIRKIDLANNKEVLLPTKQGLLQERIVALCVDINKIVWVATASNGIFAIKNDTVIGSIKKQDGLISNSCNTMSLGKVGQITVGTNEGISMIDYIVSISQPTVKNISVTDGLSSNIINHIFYQKDTFFIATENGISLMPASISAAEYPIPVKLIAIKVNERDTTIDTLYRLASNQQSISLQFAGIELKGHFDHFECLIDQSPNWNRLEGTILNLQLESGDHVISVIAKDINGNESLQPLVLSFQIATPFWKSWWFWVLVAISLQGIVGLNIYKNLKRKQLVKKQKEVAALHLASFEQQAFTSLMNPHFIFNALNSIQHYINLQDRQNANKYLSDFASLIRKNFESAQQSFIALDLELENISLYLRLEKMRFKNKFTYEIKVHENAETDDWMIPSMMLQPLVENALIHGIFPSPISGILNMIILTENKNLVIQIIDNGIGFENSKALKQNASHNSKGASLIRKRLTALNHFCKTPIEFINEKAFDSKSNSGNKVTIVLPHDLYANWVKMNG